jgi:hypothetical protein
VRWSSSSRVSSPLAAATSNCNRLLIHAAHGTRVDATRRTGLGKAGPTPRFSFPAATGVARDAAGRRRSQSVGVGESCTTWAAVE